MARPRGNRKTARISVSFADHVYASLSSLAHEQDVSIAWLVRWAVHDLIDRREVVADAVLPLEPRITSPRRSHS